MADNIRKVNLIDIDLNKSMIHRGWLNHSIGQADNKADAFGIRVFRDGAAVSLSGASVQGFFRNAEGTNIAITSGNSISGNTATVILPQACYNVEGKFTLAIKLIASGITGTMRIVDGMVDNTNTGNAVAPTGTVPTYQEVLSVYNEMVAAKEGSVRFDEEQSLTAAQKKQARLNIDAASLEGTIAPTYSENELYNAGEYTSQNGSLYRCKTEILTPEQWTPSHWKQVTLGPDFADVANSIRADIAPTYSEDEIYAVGDYRYHKGVLYRCIKKIKTPKSWSSTDWEEAVLGTEVNEKVNDLKSASIPNTMTALTGTDDIQNLTKVGFYIWGNTRPLDGGIQVPYGASVLLNMQSSATRFFQIYLTGTGLMLYRNKTSSSAWRNWVQVLRLSDIVQTSGTSETTIMSQKAATELVTSVIANAISPISEAITSKAFLNASLGSDKDLDTVYANGFYTWGNTGPVNRPVSGGGCLLNIAEGSTYTRHYQLCMTYNDSGLYIRHQTSQTTWTEWKKISDQGSASGESYAGTIEKTSTQYDVKLRKSRFIVKHEEDATINADLWRVFSGWINNGNNGWQSLWTGSDADGVVKLANETDFIGGAHGDEIFTSMRVYIDGVLVTDSTFNARNFDEVIIFAESNVYHCDTQNVAFKRNKIIQFNKDGCTVKNYWVAQENLTVLYAYFGMLSVNRYTSGDFTDILLNGYTTNGDYKYRDATTDYTGGNDVTECIMSTIYGDVGMSVKNMTPENYDGYVAIYDSESSKRAKAYFGPINSTTGIQIAQGTILKGETLYYMV